MNTSLHRPDATANTPTKRFARPRQTVSEGLIRMATEHLLIVTRGQRVASSGTLQVGTRAELAEYIVHRIVECARTAIAVRDQFTLAIPGGSVADVCLPLLMVADLPWEKVHLFWVDERAVPIADANSNAGQALRLWEGTPLAATAHWYVMFGDKTGQPTDNSAANISGGSPETASESNTATISAMTAAASAYAAKLEGVTGAPAVLDLVLLGVGEDGHIASLFPDHASALQNAPAVIAVPDSPKPPPNRLSLAFSVLASAREVIVAAFGNGKAAVMQQAMENVLSPLPVARIVREARIVHVLLDQEAAAKLRPT
ncbi:MAG: 6-phosphogluconolactonase [Gemmatimonadota bacterium]|nr:6-phosphogluconolactonase [Gemmatimonadota bacterium]